MDFEMGELVLQDMLEATISEVRVACQGIGIIVSMDLVEKFRKQRLNNPNLMQLLQNVLIDFLFASVKFYPIGGSIVISCNQTMKFGENISTMDLDLRYTSHALYCTHTTFSRYEVVIYE
jgi:phytochrome A